MSTCITKKKKTSCITSSTLTETGVASEIFSSPFSGAFVFDCTLESGCSRCSSADEKLGKI